MDLVSTGTLNYITKRAKAEGIDVNALKLDSKWILCEDCNNGLPEPGCDNCFSGYIYPEFMREVYVVFAGAIDEIFYMDDLYAVNVADWLAEDCVRIANETGEDWEVKVFIPGDDSQELIYKVSSLDN